MYTLKSKVGRPNMENDVNLFMPIMKFRKDLDD